MITPESLGLWVPGSISTQSRLYAQARKNAELLLNATLLCVDPSIGSASSLPGYAVYVRGELVSSGLIEVATAGAHNLRLFELARSLREDFAELQNPILVVEDIPTMRFNRRGSGGYSDPRAQVPLHRAVGAIMSSIRSPLMLEVPPITWHRYTDPSRYLKSDQADAAALGWTVLCMARHALAAHVRERVAKKTKRRSKCITNSQ